MERLTDDRLDATEHEVLNMFDLHEWDRCCTEKEHREIEGWVSSTKVAFAELRVLRAFEAAVYEAAGFPKLEAGYVLERDVLISIISLRRESAGADGEFHVAICDALGFRATPDSVNADVIRLAKELRATLTRVEGYRDRLANALRTFDSYPVMSVAGHARQGEFDAAIFGKPATEASQPTIEDVEREAVRVFGREPRWSSSVDLFDDEDQGDYVIDHIRCADASNETRLQFRGPKAVEHAHLALVALPSMPETTPAEGGAT